MMIPKYILVRFAAYRPWKDLPYIEAFCELPGKQRLLLISINFTPELEIQLLPKWMVHMFKQVERKWFLIASPLWGTFYLVPFFEVALNS